LIYYSLCKLQLYNLIDLLVTLDSNIYIYKVKRNISSLISISL